MQGHVTPHWKEQAAWTGQKILEGALPMFGRIAVGTGAGLLLQWLCPELVYIVTGN